MAQQGLWAPQSEGVVREGLRRAKAHARDEMRQLYEFACNYLAGRQIDDVEDQLRERYPTTQNGGSRRDRIRPIALNITERYVAEAANAYNKPVVRKVLNEDDSINDELTKQLKAMLDECGYDEHMQHLDSTVINIGTCGIWYQARRGMLHPKCVYPHDVWPVEPPAENEYGTVPFDPCCADDYAGFIVALYRGADDINASAGRRYVWMSAAEWALYEGREPWSPQDELDLRPNPLAWPQVVDTPDGKGSPRTLPLLPLGFWHRHMPTDELILDIDPVVALANRELNIQLSVLLDTLAHQGWSIPYFQLLDPSSAPQALATGPRQGFALQLQEQANMLTSATPFSEITQVLRDWVKLIAVVNRQSSNDFAIEGTGPQSGFAKLVDSLPKIEARNERIARLRRAEQQVAWPRIAAIGVRAGKLSGSIEQLAKCKLRVDFADVEMPLNVSEEAQKQDHEFRYGLSSPAEVLAKRRGITIDEAKDIIAQNLGAAPGALVSVPEGLDKGAATGDAPGAIASDATGEQVDIQKTALNGAQVASLVEVLGSVARKELPRESAVALLQIAFQVTADEADAILGPLGESFFTEVPAPKGPVPPSAPNEQPPAPKPAGAPGSSGLLGKLIAGRQAQRAGQR